MDLTIAQAAARLGTHHTTVRRYVASGLLPAVRVGPRLLRVSSADVEALARPLPTAASR